MQAIVKALLFIPYLAIVVILLLIISLTFAFAWVCGLILDIVLSPSFISLSYTNPDGNPVIKSGLSITQSFVNLILVLALVYTALSIALRINETQAKKILVRLIIVALIVNFAPVFLGLVVDATNITTSYFLKPLKEGVSGVFLQMSVIVELVKRSVLDAQAEIVDSLGVLMICFTLIILNIFIGIAFFLFAGIFLFRYIAIWVLVILAPLAFVAWIFPSGRIRGFFDIWLNNFIQWSIIGIPMAFFLYLGLSNFSLLTAEFRSKIELSGLDIQSSDYFGQIFPYFVVLTFLFLGFFFGLSSSAIGANAAISSTLQAGRALRGGAVKMAKKGGRKILSPIQKWGEAQATVGINEALGTGKFGKIMSSKPGKILGWGTALTPTAWALRRGIGEAFLWLKDAEIKEVKDAEAKYKGTIAQQKAAAMTNPLKPATEKVGALRTAVDEGQVDSLKKLLKDTGLSDNQIDNQIISLMKEALRIDPNLFKNLRDAFPHLAEIAGKSFDKAVQQSAGVDPQQAISKGYGSVMEKIIAQMDPDKIKFMDTSIFSHPIFGKQALDAVIKHWDAKAFAEAGRYLGRAFTAAIKTEFSARPQDFIPSAQKYLNSSASRKLY